MVTAVREAEQALGGISYALTDKEQASTRYFGDPCTLHGICGLGMF
jgi:hypothetical protein